MLTKDDLERERYEARRKAQLDINTGLKVARMEGEKIGIIRLSEQLLHRPQTPAADFAALSLEELTQMADDLQTQLREQR